MGTREGVGTRVGEGGGGGHRRGGGEGRRGWALGTVGSLGCFHQQNIIQACGPSFFAFLSPLAVLIGIYCSCMCLQEYYATALCTSAYHCKNLCMSSACSLENFRKLGTKKTFPSVPSPIFIEHDLCFLSRDNHIKESLWLVKHCYAGATKINLKKMVYKG